MPIYDYVCENCGDFEDIKNVDNSDESSCPKCGRISSKKEVQGVNKFMAKTKYIPPPVAKKVLGEKRKQPHRRPKWV